MDLIIIKSQQCILLKLTAEILKTVCLRQKSFAEGNWLFFQVADSYATKTTNDLIGHFNFTSCQQWLFLFKRDVKFKGHADINLLFSDKKCFWYESFQAKEIKRKTEITDAARHNRTLFITNLFS